MSVGETFSAALFTSTTRLLHDGNRVSDPYTPAGVLEERFCRDKPLAELVIAEGSYAAQARDARTMRAVPPSGAIRL